jgi:hypothetical protein
MNIRQWFCRHSWTKLSEAVMPSAFEQLARTGEYKLDVSINTEKWIFRKKVVITMMCEKCKKLQQFVEINP